MSLFLKKVVAIAALPLAAGGLLVGLMSAAPALAADMPGSVSDPSSTPAPLASQEATVSAETKTVPWCGWTVSGLPTGLALTDSEATVSAPSKYKGAEIILGGSNTGIAAFVSGGNAVTTDADNCSWYGDGNKQGLAMTVTASRDNFTARAAGEAADDAGMGFSLATATNPLTITPTYDACSAAFVTSANLSVSTDNLTSNPVTASDKTLVDTVSSCTWGLTYAAKIPAGMKPLFGDKLYTFTGPTLTTTVNIN